MAAFKATITTITTWYLMMTITITTWYLMIHSHEDSDAIKASKA